VIPEALSDQETNQLYEWGRADPGWWMQTVLGDKPWSAQLELACALRDNREVAVKSCNSAGKSWISGRIVLWFLHTHIPSVVITTAPTDRQVKHILWQEIRTAHSHAVMPLGGSSPLIQEVHLEDGWYAMGFTASEYDATRFQGFHAKHVLVVVDEAAGVSELVFEGVQSILAGGVVTRLLMIGNPTDPTSHFAKAFKTAGVTKRSISAFDTPNFTEFGITSKDIQERTWEAKVNGRDLPMPHLITPEWVAERYVRWGPENPVYQSRVLAEFPEQATDSLIPLSLIEHAQRRTLEPNGVNHLGVDVARMGGDETVIYQRRGPVVRLIHSSRGLDTMQTVGHIIEALRVSKASIAHVDADGLGAGVVDRLVEQKHPVKPAHGGTRPRDPERFLNRRAEWFWTLRELFESGEIDIDPNDDELAAQLSSLKWKLNSRGQIVIESKDDMRRRGLVSPDRGDGVAYCFAQPDRAIGDHGVTI